MVPPSAKEVLMMLSASQGSLLEAEAKGGKGPLWAAGAHPAVRLLLPADEYLGLVVEALKEVMPRAEVRALDGSLQIKASVLIVDRKKVAILGTNGGAPRVLAFTESESLAGSYAALFECVWKQGALCDKLKTDAKIQQDFITIAAHELRTPVQAILNYAELARSRPESQEEYHERLLRSAFRLRKLTEDILDTAKIGSTTLRLNKEEFLLNEVLKGAVDEQYREAARKGLKLCAEEQEPIYIFGDRSKIGQVLANLLTNAVKFTDEGSVRIAARLDRRRRRALVRVADTGIGIEKLAVPLLFARFVARPESGMGLGLLVSKGIVEAHGGKIWLERSEPGRGSVFTFELPLGRLPHRPGRTTAAPQRERRPAQLGTPETHYGKRAGPRVGSVHPGLGNGPSFIET